jgi:hypothetical protein
LSLSQNRIVFRAEAKSFIPAKAWRKPGESRNPEILPIRLNLGIPAFAGMTISLIHC